MNSPLSPPWCPGHRPAQQPQLARAVLVHDDAQGQRDGTEQEGADGEGQVQHLVLGVARWPLVLCLCAVLVLRAARGVSCTGQQRSIIVACWDRAWRQAGKRGDSKIISIILIVISKKWRRERKRAEGQGTADEVSSEQRVHRRPGTSLP